MGVRFSFAFGHQDRASKITPPRSRHRDHILRSRRSRNQDHAAKITPRHHERCGGPSLRVTQITPPRSYPLREFPPYKYIYIYEDRTTKIAPRSHHPNPSRDHEDHATEITPPLPHHEIMKIARVDHFGSPRSDHQDHIHSANLHHEDHAAEITPPISHHQNHTTSERCLATTWSHQTP